MRMASRRGLPPWLPKQGSRSAALSKLLQQRTTLDNFKYSADPAGANSRPRAAHGGPQAEMVARHVATHSSWADLPELQRS